MSKKRTDKTAVAPPAETEAALRAQNRMLIAQAEALRAELAESRDEVVRLSTQLLEMRDTKAESALARSRRRWLPALRSLIRRDGWK